MQGINICKEEWIYNKLQVSTPSYGKNTLTSKLQFEIQFQDMYMAYYLDLFHGLQLLHIYYYRIITYLISYGYNTFMM